MIECKPRFLIDDKGEKVGVFLGFDEYKRLLDELEEIDCTRAFDAALAEGGELIPLEVAAKRIESERA